MPHSPGALYSVLLAALWFVGSAFGIVRCLKNGGRTRWLGASGWIVVMIGGSGFFAPSLLQEGVFRPSSALQWPAGYVNGVATTPDGKYVVPLSAPGRVQLYDSRWRFIRGWQVRAGGGDLKVETTPEGTIEVFTSRGLQHYSFTQEGVPILAVRSGAGADDNYGFLPRGKSIAVPTSRLLWVFSSPFLCLLVTAIGMAGLAIEKKLAAPKMDQVRNH
jgi:hypothetical protein